MIIKYSDIQKAKAMKNQKVYHIITMIAIAVMFACILAILFTMLKQGQKIQSLSFPISFQPCHAASSIISAAGTIWSLAVVMPKFRTPYNYDNALEDKEICVGSMTTPDDALTVKELLQNYVKGLPLPAEKTPYYLGQQDFDEIPSNMTGDTDLSDITEAKIKKERIMEEIAIRKAQQQARRKADEQSAASERSNGSEADGSKRAKGGSEEADGGLASEVARQQPRNKGAKNEA